MNGRDGTTNKRSRRQPIPEFHGKITKRADDRARIQINTLAEFDKLDAAIGVMLIVDAIFSDGEFEVVAADIYAVHSEHRLIDVHLRYPLAPEAKTVVIKRSCLGVMR